jgi:hypothetical protein
MKLRSGKTLSTFPSKLNDELETKLQEFKTLFSGNMQHAKELLDIIIEATSTDIRIAIRAKIEENYDIHNVAEINPLMGAAGGLACLLIKYPQYHDIIENKI